MGIGASDNKCEAIMCLEDTNGVYKAPVASDKNFPMGKVEYSSDPRTKEGLRAANGKYSPARKHPAGTLGTVTIPSSLMKVADIETAIEVAPLFEMSGFQVIDNGGNKELYFDGDGNCATGSMRVFNKGCGTASGGLGTDFRGMHGSITLKAETAGSEFEIVFEGQAGIEGTPMSAKTSISSGFVGDTVTRAVEYLEGAVTLGGVATAIEGLSLSMNVELKEKKSTLTGKHGIDYIAEVDIKPVVSITAPIGTDTATWWPNVLDGSVISSFTYIGTYWNITMTDLVIGSMAKNADGIISLTQELEPTTILLAPKTV